MQERGSVLDCFPSDVNDIWNARNHRAAYIEIFGRINNLAQYVQSVLIELHTLQEAQIDAPRFIALYNAWHRVFIEESPTVNEVRHYANMDGDSEKEPIRRALGVHIFAELSRIHMILSFHPLRREEAELLQLTEVPNREAQMRYQTRWSIAMLASPICNDFSEEVRAFWEVPAVKYTQSQVMLAVNMLAEALNDFTRPDEFIQYFRALFTRNAVFLCQRCSEDILDVEDMRTQKGELYEPNHDYWVWCSIYFGAIMRRIHYYQKLEPHQMDPPIPIRPEQVDRCKEWVARLITILGDDGARETYAAACDESYRIPGDYEWFTFNYSGEQPIVATILQRIRPVLSKRYWKEAHVTPESAIETSHITVPRFMGRTSQLFVIHLVDTYLKSIGVRWRNAAVVAQEEIELSAYKLQKPVCPVLLQAFSRWWPYHNLQYARYDDIYEALTAWFYLLKTRHRYMLFDHSLRKVTDHILGSE